MQTDSLKARSFGVNSPSAQARPAIASTAAKQASAPIASIRPATRAVPAVPSRSPRPAAARAPPDDSGAAGQPSVSPAPTGYPSPPPSGCPPPRTPGDIRAPCRPVPEPRASRAPAGRQATSAAATADLSADGARRRKAHMRRTRMTRDATRTRRESLNEQATRRKLTWRLPTRE